MQIEIDPPITVPRSLTAFEILSQTDAPGAKTVTATVSIAGLDNPVSLVLWSGAGYDEAGDWTQEDADARVAALIQANYGE
jgi:hypothetical protein